MKKYATVERVLFEQQRLFAYFQKIENIFLGKTAYKTAKSKKKI